MMKIKGIMDLYYEIEELQKLPLAEASKHITVMDDTYVKVQDILARLRKARVSKGYQDNYLAIEKELEDYDPRRD